MINNEPLQTPLVDKFFHMGLNQQQMPNRRQLDFNQDMDMVEEQGEEEHKIGRNLFTSHNPSNSNLFNDDDLILGKS